MNAALRETLLALDTSVLADADKSLRVMGPELRPLAPGLKLLGIARTVVAEEDFLTVIRAIDESAPGEVLVVDTRGSRRAVLGELFSIEARRRGLAGIVVDGPVRDVATLRTLDLPVWARSHCPCAGTTQRLFATQVPVQCGGVEVAPGDVLVGDDDGIIVASAAELAQLAPRAQAIAAAEAELRRRMAGGEGLITMLNYAEHRAAIERGEESALAFRL
jgi:RraA family protein